MQDNKNTQATKGTMNETKNTSGATDQRKTNDTSSTDAQADTNKASDGTSKTSK